MRNIGARGEGPEREGLGHTMVSIGVEGRDALCQRGRGEGRRRRGGDGEGGGAGKGGQAALSHIPVISRRARIDKQVLVNDRLVKRGSVRRDDK